MSGTGTLHWVWRRKNLPDNRHRSLPDGIGEAGCFGGLSRSPCRSTGMQTGFTPMTLSWKDVWGDASSGIVGRVTPCRDGSLAMPNPTDVNLALSFEVKDQARRTRQPPGPKTGKAQKKVDFWAPYL
ncbi:MAG: hypothetical protein ACYC9S_05960 [Leptospirales bacterium]